MTWNPTIVHLPCHCFKHGGKCPQGKTGDDRGCTIAVDELLILDVMRDLTVQKFKLIQEKDVDNQHQKIKGYRDLTQEEIDVMNDLKQLENLIAAKIRELMDSAELDMESLRMLNLAKTNLQQGFMWAIRAIAKPESNWQESSL